MTGSSAEVHKDDGQRLEGVSVFEVFCKTERRDTGKRKVCFNSRHNVKVLKVQIVAFGVTSGVAGASGVENEVRAEVFAGQVEVAGRLWV